MYLLNFMNNHKTDWKELLSKAPFYLSINQTGDYYILKYNMIQSDFSNPIVLEARGSIFRKTESGDGWICVCRALDKFGNYGESYAATPYMNWENGVDVQEKIDGSIIKLWFDKGDWHISTNGTIDAFEAECGDTNFGDIFLSLLGSHVHEFFSALHPSLCYFFEMVSTYNHIVISYKENAIYYLGSRNMITLEEEYDDDLNFDFIKTPRHFSYYSLAECVAAAHEMGDDEEGYVCVSHDMANGSYYRIKVKGDEYLRLHKIRGNGPLTLKRIIDMWRSNSLDDFIAYFPEYNDYINRVCAQINNLIFLADSAYTTVNHFTLRADFARSANTYIHPIRSYLFARLDNKVKDANEFFQKYSTNGLVNYLRNITDLELKGEVVEDE